MVLKVPDPHELEKELNEYLTKKYGNRIRLATPMVIPQKDEDIIDQGSEQHKQSKKITFDLKPEELESYLNEFVVKQEDPKEVLATKICTHFNRIKYRETYTRSETSDRVGMIKNNIIMIGPTGVGKTYLIKLIAKKIGVPFVKGDATKFSETGYVGGDVDDLVRDLVHEAEGDIERAQYGIIYIDEIDKIASGSNAIGVDVSRTGVQRGLLKPMEETEVDLKVPHDIVSQMEAMEHFRRTGQKERRVINTKDILFIVSGAFNGLADIISKRVNREGIGFRADPQRRDSGAECLKMVTPEDLMHYGFESEFIGRLPVITAFVPLTTDDLYRILKNLNSAVINSKKQDFKSYGIDVRFEDEALYAIAERACAHTTGARALVSVIEKVLMKFEKTLPSTAIKRLVVTKEIVDNPARELALLLDAGESKEQRARYLGVVKREKDDLRELIMQRKKSFPLKHQELLSGARTHLIVNRVVDTGSHLTVVLEEILALLEDTRNYEASFFEKTGIKICFHERAADRLVEQVLKQGVPLEVYCNTLFKSYHHGLNLVREKSGTSEFILGREAITDPEGYLDKLIKASYDN
jgi:endopeptidase Clp ATP-binding regulatory subunit ClpX